MNLKKILVTGGAGFIGSHLVEQLFVKGYDVVVLDNLTGGNKLKNIDNSRFKLIEGDVRDKNIVSNAMKGCSSVIHLAAVVGVDEVINRAVEMMETETIGTANIVEAALKNKVKKILYASSSAVYHNLESDVNKESDDSNLVNAYAIAKGLNEKYLEAVAASEKISINSLRFFNVYGNRQDDRMVIPRFFKQAVKNEPIIVFGTGKQTRDFTHVDDVAKGMILLNERLNLDGVFNICKGVETSIFDIAKKIKKISNSKSVIELIGFPEERIDYKIERRVGCSEKLFVNTGFRPSIHLENGLTEIYQSLYKRATSTS